MFYEKSLLKCSETLKTKKRLGIKCSDFELPSSVDGESGFHISCYRCFNALSQSTGIKIKRKSPKKSFVSCVRRCEIESSSPASWKNFAFFVTRTARRKIINGIHL